MYLKASTNPKFDPAVQTIQMKLNAINNQVHGNWPYLKTDGLFGEQTKLAVKAFQSYRNITPISGEVGNTTLRYIDDSYNHIPQIKASSGSSNSNDNNADLTAIINKFNAFVKDQFFGILKSIQGEYECQVNNLRPFQNMKISSAKSAQLM